MSQTISISYPAITMTDSSSSSSSLDSIHDAPETGSADSRSSSPDLFPPPPPAPPPLQCNDWHHCDLSGTGTNCGGTFHLCPGIDPTGMNLTYGPPQIPHPAPPANIMGFAVRVCDNCSQHDYPHPNEKRRQIRAWATSHEMSGNLVRLCNTCTRDEMELYWERLALNTPVVALPVTAAPSLQEVSQWPTAAAPEQNLCVCHSRAITTYQHYCHMCRDLGFYYTFTLPYQRNELFLVHKSKSVLSGQQQCNLDDAGFPALNITRRERVRRLNAQIGRMCPCGKDPPASDNEAPFIGFCLCCSGVRVIDYNIPRKYRRANVARGPLRRSPRNHAPSVGNRTKGPVRALRSHLNRVNIERGWVQNDPLIGPT